MHTLKQLWYGLLTVIMTTPVMADLSLEMPEKPLEDQWIVSVGAWSKHLTNADRNYNETHNLFAVEHDSWSAGYFLNSHNRDTFFIAKNWRKEFFENIEGFASLGINYGYTRCIGDDGSAQNVCPHGWLGLSYTKYKVVPAIRVLPGVIVFSPEVRF